MYDEKINLGIEVQDIFQQFAPAYLQTHKLPLQHLKVASAISFCRTSRLGAHTDCCDECGHIRISYNLGGNYAFLVGSCPIFVIILHLLSSFYCRKYPSSLFCGEGKRLNPHNEVAIDRGSVQQGVS